MPLILDRKDYIYTIENMQPGISKVNHHTYIIMYFQLLALGKLTAQCLGVSTVELDDFGLSMRCVTLAKLLNHTELQLPPR